VDCIFIDPPYTTGNEGSCYNDHVNSPMMREWLAMMLPRLRVL
jgi:adenine specific DNA methylase Mod